MRSKSRLKDVIAKNMYNSVITDIRTHFKARYRKLVAHLLGDDSEGNNKLAQL